MDRMGLFGLFGNVSNAFRHSTTLDKEVEGSYSPMGDTTRRRFLGSAAAGAAALSALACGNDITGPKSQPQDPTLELKVNGQSSTTIRGRTTANVSGTASPGYQGVLVDSVDLDRGDGSPVTNHIGRTLNVPVQYENLSIVEQSAYTLRGTAHQSDGRTKQATANVVVQPAGKPVIDQMDFTPTSGFGMIQPVRF